MLRPFVMRQEPTLVTENLLRTRVAALWPGVGSSRAALPVAGALGPCARLEWSRAPAGDGAAGALPRYVLDMDRFRRDGLGCFHWFEPLSAATFDVRFASPTSWPQPDWPPGVDHVVFRTSVRELGGPERPHIDQDGLPIAGVRLTRPEYKGHVVIPAFTQKRLFRIRTLAYSSPTERPETLVSDSETYVDIGGGMALEAREVLTVHLKGGSRARKQAASTQRPG